MGSLGRRLLQTAIQCFIGSTSIQIRERLLSFCGFSSYVHKISILGYPVCCFKSKSHNCTCACFCFRVLRNMIDVLQSVPRQLTLSKSALWCLGDIQQRLLSQDMLQQGWDCRRFHNELRDLVSKLPYSRDRPSEQAIPADSISRIDEMCNTMGNPL